jgi:hypothetical protein
MDYTSAFSLNSSSANPTDRLHFNEYIVGLAKAGSLISMLEGKKINTTNLLLLILEKKDYQDFFVEITSSKSFRDSILTLLYLYPSLVKSKFTKAYTRKLINGTATKSKNTNNRS